MNRIKHWLYRATGRPAGQAGVVVGTEPPAPERGSCRTTGCNGDPFIPDPCPVEDRGVGCDDPENWHRCTALCGPVECVVDLSDQRRVYGCQNGCGA